MHQCFTAASRSTIMRIACVSGMLPRQQIRLIVKGKKKWEGRERHFVSHPARFIHLSSIRAVCVSLCQHYFPLSSINFTFYRSILFCFLLLFDTKTPPHSVILKLVRSPFSLSFFSALSRSPQPLPVSVGSVFLCAPVCKHLRVRKKISPLLPK